jgi:hypothetical protein
MKDTTVPELFIIESLAFEEEEHHREGQIISSILRMSGKHCKYFYIRTKSELKNVVRQFGESKYRYLHLSCHGGWNHKSLHTTLHTIPFSELGTILRPHLRNRRVFLSSCSTTNKHIATALMKGSGCLSILGPLTDIHFDSAAILWSSLYHVMFKEDRKRMQHRNLMLKAQQTADIFRVRLNYIRKDLNKPGDFEIIAIDPKREPKKAHPTKTSK